MEGSVSPGRRAPPVISRTRSPYMYSNSVVFRSMPPLSNVDGRRGPRLAEGPPTAGVGRAPENPPYRFRAKRTAKCASGVPGARRVATHALPAMGASSKSAPSGLSRKRFTTALFSVWVTVHVA